MTANGMPDTETYLHRIGRTGRFGRVGVSISLIYDSDSWLALTHIGRFFGVPLTGIDTSDWDAVESAVKKVIKSSRKENAAEDAMTGLDRESRAKAEQRETGQWRVSEVKADKREQGNWQNTEVKADRREQGDWQNTVVKADEQQQGGWHADEKEQSQFRW